MIMAVAAAAVEREVDMRRAGRRVFLIKAPVYLAKAWAEAGAGADLGRLFLNPAALPVIEGSNIDGSTTTSTTAAGQKRKRVDDGPIPQGVVGRLMAGGSEGAVREHTISFVKLPEPSYCFSDSEKGFAVEGAARVRLDAQPVFSKEYRSFVKVREEKENVKTRELKRIDNNETDIKRPRPSLLKPKKKEDLVQDKMTRMPRSELIELIFSCFRRQEHWSLTALREYTQQPVVYLKEVLNEVCTYNKKGEHRSTFELRPEFREEKKKPAADPPA